MNASLQFGCTTLAAAFLSDRGVSQALRARLWQGPGKFLPSEHRRLLERRLPESGRFGIVVARKQDLRAARAAASELLRYDLSLRAHGRRDGRVLHARGRPDGRLHLLSRAHFLQRHALLQANATVVSHPAIRMKPADLKAAMHGSSPRHRQRICARGYVFSQTWHRCGMRQNLSPIPVLLPVQDEMRRLKGLSYSMRRTSRCRPARDAANAESRTRPMREAP